MSTYVEIGRVALRDRKTGGFQKPIKLYVKTEEEILPSGLAESEEKLTTDVAGIFADKMRQYIKYDKQLQKVLGDAEQ